MPIFETPHPISLTIQLNLGTVRIFAGDRTDTVVEVHPSHPSRDSDVRAAEQVLVEYADGKLLIRGPQEWRRYAIWTGNGSVDVTVSLPLHSEVRGDLGMGGFDCEGTFGLCDLKTGNGKIRLDRTGPVWAESGYGNISINRAAGDATVKAGSGHIRIESVDGALHSRNSDGHTTIGAVAGDVHIKAANGDIVIDNPQGSISAKTANGDIRVDGVVRGSLVLETASGNLSVGISEGTAAWLDVSTHYGKVRNSLSASDGPGASAETVEVHGRTSYGNVEIHRSPAPAEAEGWKA
jgi:DUF4097 and DUF4098 domain-containing protein YvlB